eukprot:m.169274 g.169274  ORF g.169274 m.169274 type:complete len:550 (+) comp13083_c0_seq1:333-1982(+)
MHHPHPPPGLGSSPQNGAAPRTFSPFRSKFHARRPLDSAHVSKGSSPSPDACEFLAIGKLDDNLETLQKSVFDRLRPLDSSPASGSAGGSASPGLVEDMNVLSVNERGDNDEGEDAKPSISFACLIGMAILSAEDRRLTVSEIYQWMKDTYPYFNNATVGNGWKNSVRHNLSLNKHFVRLNRDPEDHLHGKGSYWMIRPESVPAMESAIRKQEASGASPSRSSPARSSVSSDRSSKTSGNRSRRSSSSVRPSPSSRRTAPAPSRRDSIDMDDTTAATMLCALGDTTEDDEFGSPLSGGGASPPSALSVHGPMPPSGLGATGPNMARRRLASRAYSASTVVFPSPSARRNRPASNGTTIKASYSATPSKTPQKPGKKGTNSRTFTYVSPASMQWRRDTTSAGFASTGDAAQRLFQPHPPATAAAGGSAMVVETESAASRGNRITTAGGEAVANGDRRFFTFSAPMSSLGQTPENRRYTPEGATIQADRAPSGHFATEQHSRFGQPAPCVGVSPPKTRRKLEIGAERRTESDASAAAALLGLSGSSMMLCN